MQHHIDHKSLEKELHSLAALDGGSKTEVGRTYHQLGRIVAHLRAKMASTVGNQDMPLWNTVEQFLSVLGPIFVNSSSLITPEFIPARKEVTYQKQGPDLLYFARGYPHVRSARVSAIDPEGQQTRHSSKL